MLKYKALRGTQDILADEMPLWRQLEETVERKMKFYNYQEISTPTFEHTGLFVHSTGADTEIVEKQMYTFLDKGGRSLTLRPEGTPPVVRTYIEHSLGMKKPLQKLFYIGSMYRQENPQAGRLRQFHQFGAEAIGSIAPALDAEIISLFLDICEDLGLKELSLQLGSIGCPGCRPPYREKLLGFFADKYDLLCADCKQRHQRNPLRILDCKNPSCRRMTEDAPSMLDYLCDDCARHFQELKAHLNTLDIEYQINRRLVRGLDYYTKTIFEVVSPQLGAQDALGGGGRYDGLIEELGAKPTPAVGFAAGIERILLAMEKENCPSPEPCHPKVYVASMGEEAKRLAVRLLQKLRTQRVSADTDYLDRSLKSQMRAANNLKVRYTVIIGQEELNKGKALVRNMESSQQEEVEIENLGDYLVEVLNQNQ
jgi:histidyl-tRNA synthetase